MTPSFKYQMYKLNMQKKKTLSYKFQYRFIFCTAGKSTMWDQNLVSFDHLDQNLNKTWEFNYVIHTTSHVNKSKPSQHRPTKEIFEISSIKIHDNILNDHNLSSSHKRQQQGSIKILNKMSVKPSELLPNIYFANPLTKTENKLTTGGWVNKIAFFSLVYETTCNIPLTMIYLPESRMKQTWEYYHLNTELFNYIHIVLTKNAFMNSPKNLF